MARGIPSRRRQISTTNRAVASSKTNVGSAARARATKSATAGMAIAPSHEISVSGAAVDNGSTDHTCSPATASGSRLVATTDTEGASLRIRLTSAATGSMRCSQLSSSRRLWRGRSISAIASSIELLRRRLTSIAVANAADVASSSTTLTSSTTWTPSEYPAAAVRASSRPTDVFPTPPGPTSVMRRWAASASTRSAISDSRPINGWMAVSKPAIVGTGELGGATVPGKVSIGAMNS